MKTFKKIFSLILALMMAFTLLGCDGEKSAQEESSAAASAPQDAVKQYYLALQETDASVLIPIYPECYLAEYREVENGMETDLEEELAATLDYYVDTYGENVKFEITAAEVEEMPEDFIEKVKNEYSEQNLDSSTVEEAALVRFDITVKGDKDEGEGKGAGNVIKENGVWKLHYVNADI